MAGDNPVTAASIARQCGILARDAELPSLASLSTWSGDDGQMQAQPLNGAGAGFGASSGNGAGLSSSSNAGAYNRSYGLCAYHAPALLPQADASCMAHC